MKKILLSVLAIIFISSVLVASVDYYSEEEYKDLSKEERTAFWDKLNEALADYQQRKADAINSIEANTKAIPELKAKIQKIDSEYEILNNEILASLGISKSDLIGIQEKIGYFNRNLDNWNNLSDDQIWDAKRDIKNISSEYSSYRKTNSGKVPNFRKEFSDLDRRFENISVSLNNAKPKYYEEDYQVKSGDYLSKISAYDFIYGDASKWGIIYRANRDQIKDPNIIHENQVLKIPRGKPYFWSVYKGECLWKIASYPEVYGKGSQWPKIYRANNDKIKDPDLIYPNQKLEIPRD